MSAASGALARRGWASLWRREDESRAARAAWTGWTGVRRRLRASGRVDVRTRGDVLTVRLSGEVDLALRADVEEAVRTVRRHGGPVRLDLRGVTFFGAEGVAMLMALHRAALRDRVTVVGTSPAVERTLALCGITRDVLPRPR